MHKLQRFESYTERDWPIRFVCSCGAIGTGFPSTAQCEFEFDAHVLANDPERAALRAHLNALGV